MTPVPYADWVEPPDVVFYGAEDDEGLSADSIEQYVEDLLDQCGETPDESLDRMTWPLLVMAYRRRVVADEAIEFVAAAALDDVTEHLDEEYGDPNGRPDDDPLDPTWRAIMLAAVRQIVSTYAVQMCEGCAVIAVSREDARGMIGLTMQDLQAHLPDILDRMQHILRQENRKIEEAKP